MEWLRGAKFKFMVQTWRTNLYNGDCGMFRSGLKQVVFVAESLCGRHEKRLLNELLSTYNTLERPVANESEPLEVRFGITLQQIIDVVSLSPPTFFFFLNIVNRSIVATIYEARQLKCQKMGINISSQWMDIVQPIRSCFLFDFKVDLSSVQIDGRAVGD